jgi:RNA polymerase sigma-70 factor (ECF subfamily)
MTTSILKDFKDPTSKSLLSQLKVGNPMAWTRITKVYGPLIAYWCRRRFFLNAEDTEDVCQSVLQNVVNYGTGFEKHPDKGGFRVWLYTITRNEVIKLLKSDRASESFDPQLLAQILGGEVSRHHDPEDPPEVLNALQRRALQIVQNSVKASTWEIFMTAIAQEDLTAVAMRFGIKPNRVRQIKYRLLGRFRDLLEPSDDGSSASDRC